MGWLWSWSIQRQSKSGLPSLTETSQRGTCSGLPRESLSVCLNCLSIRDENGIGHKCPIFRQNLPANAGDLRGRFYSWVRKISLRRACQPTQVFLPGDSHGQRSLVGCSLWGHKELDTTEWLTLSISRSSTPNSRHSREKTCFHTVSILKDSQSSQCKR